MAMNRNSMIPARAYLDRSFMTPQRKSRMDNTIQKYI